MAIKTSTFGSVTLTGEAAKAFEEQFIKAPPKPKPAAKNALAEGRRMLKEYIKKGYVTVKHKK